MNSYHIHLFHFRILDLTTVEDIIAVVLSLNISEGFNLSRLASDPGISEIITAGVHYSQSIAQRVLFLCMAV